MGVARNQGLVGAFQETRPQAGALPFPFLQDTEIINTAILTGRTVAIPVKVIAIEVTGIVLDVSALVECESDNEDIIKVGFLEAGPPAESRWLPLTHPFILISHLPCSPYPRCHHSFVRGWVPRTTPSPQPGVLLWSILEGFL